MTEKPWLLDLFCGAGGCTKGYQRAGFRVVGVDNSDQPNYCGEVFIQADALEFLAALVRGERVHGYVLEDFAATHASPPCQAYAGSTAWRGDRANHPQLIAPTRALLKDGGLPYVIENVPDARRELHHPLLLCGTALGLRVRRHRHFELSWPWPALQHPCHHQADDFAFDHGGKQPESVYRSAMGCEWMTVQESREAIPPAFTELIGHQLMQHIRAATAA